MTTRPARETDSRESRGQRSDDPASWLDVHGNALYRYARARREPRSSPRTSCRRLCWLPFQSRDRFQNRSSVRTWLLSILRHKIIDHYRSREPGRQPTQGNNQTTDTHITVRRGTDEAMSWSNDLLKILVLRCEEASILSSREIDEPLRLAERFALRGHLLVCNSCRTLRRQLRFLHATLQRRGIAIGEDGTDPEALSPEARMRIEGVLAEASDQGNGASQDPSG